jgi:hypothetical protein
MHELVHLKIKVCRLDNGLVTIGCYSETIIINMTAPMPERVYVTNEKPKKQGLLLSDKLAGVKNSALRCASHMIS